MYCKNCGKEIKSGDRFCKNCGAAQNECMEEGVSEAQETGCQDSPPGGPEKAETVKTDPSLFAEDRPEEKKKPAKKTLVIVLVTVIILALAGGATACFYFFGVAHGRVQVAHFGKEARFNFTKDELVQIINETISGTEDWLPAYPDVKDWQKADLNSGINNEKQEDGFLERFTEDDWVEENNSDTTVIYKCPQKQKRPQVTITADRKSRKVLQIDLSYDNDEYNTSEVSLGREYRVWQYITLKSCDPEITDPSPVYEGLGTLGDPLHNYLNSFEKETTRNYITCKETGNHRNMTGMILQFSVIPSVDEAGVQDSVSEPENVSTPPGKQTLTAADAASRLNGSWQTEDTNTFSTRFKFVEGHLEYVYESYRSKANQLWFEADYDLQIKDGSTAVLTLKNIDNKGMAAMPDRYDKPLDFTTLEVDFTETEDGSILINGEKAHQTTPAK